METGDGAGRRHETATTGATEIASYREEAGDGDCWKRKQIYQKWLQRDDWRQPETVAGM